MQIKKDVSIFLYLSFGVPLGSILGPILCNVCVADMSVTVNNCERLQFANDLAIYRDCKVKGIVQATNHLECELCHLLKCSEDTNLVFNHCKLNPRVLGPNIREECTI